MAETVKRDGNIGQETDMQNYFLKYTINYISIVCVCVRVASSFSCSSIESKLLDSTRLVYTQHSILFFLSYIVAYLFHISLNITIIYR